MATKKYGGKDYLADVLRGMGAGLSGRQFVPGYQAQAAGMPEAAGVSPEIFSALMGERKSEELAQERATLADYINKMQMAKQQIGIEQRGAEARKTAQYKTTLGDKITADDPMLPDYATALKVKPDQLIGKDANQVMGLFGRVKSRQERVEYSDPEPILNESGDTIGYFQRSSQGKLSTTPMPLAAGASQKTKDLDSVNGIITDLFNTAKGFDPESGPVQRVLGATNVAKAKLGLAAEKKAYMDGVDSFLGNLAREYSGERGVLTDQDIGRIKSAMPTLYDTDDEIDYKFKQIQRVISQRKEAIESGKLVVPLGKKGKENTQTKVGGDTWVKTPNGWVKK